MLHQVFLFARLNAFSNDFEVKSRRQTGDGFNDRLVFLVTLTSTDKRPIDLKARDRIVLQKAERRETGSEVIESNADAE
ncbi:hypothetical protein A6R70_01030 [Agrobacterium rubi]|nr:hypothetical protein [Agrobacterium rubi]